MTVLPIPHRGKGGLSQKSVGNERGLPCFSKEDYVLNVRSFAEMLLFVPFIMPDSITNYSQVIHGIFFCWQLLSSIVILFRFFRDADAIVLRGPFVFIFLYSVFIVFNTIWLANGAFLQACSNVFSALVMSVEVYRLLLVDSWALLRSVLPLLECLVVLNFICILIFPNGLYQITTSLGTWSDNAWLLGLGNVHMNIILPLMLMLFVKNEFDKDSSKTELVVMSLVSLMSVMLVQSSTSTIGIALMLGSYFLYFRALRHAINPMAVVLIIIVVFIIILSGHTAYLSDILSQWFDKDVTFSGRINIWEKAIEAILASPIYGHGYTTSAMMLYSMGFSAATQCHNFILQVLYYGGIVLLILFGFVIIFTVKHLMVPSCYSKSRIAVSSLIGLSTYLLMESAVQMVLLFPCLLILSELDRFCDNNS